MKSNKEKSFYEVSNILSQLDSHKTKEEVDEAVAGFDFNMVRDNDELMLSKMAFEGEAKAVKYLLEKGADPDLESSSYHYYKGPAILFALQNNRSKTSTKVEILKLLIDYGSDINAKVRWFDEEQERTIIGNYIEYGLTLSMENLQVINSNEYDVESRKSSKKEVEGLQAMLIIIKEGGINLSTDTAQKLDEFLKVQTTDNKKVNAEEFLKKALSELDVKDRINDLPEAAKNVCYEYLEKESFIPSKEWAALVRHLVDISLTFEEVSEEVYDEIISFEDDEGWLCQGWENYNWFSELVEVLSGKNALKNPEWDDLLILIIKEHQKYDVSIKSQIEELLEEPWVRSHPSFPKIVDITGYKF